MSVLNRNPQNTNYLQPTKFLLTFSRISNTQYFCQEVNIPGVTLGEVQRTTPFLDMYSPGTKMTYEPLKISFILNEDMQSWKDMYNWFTSIADPDGFEGRDHPRELQQNKHLSDCTLTVLSALNNPIMRIHYTNCFPVTMGSVNFDTKLSSETIMTCDVTFRYQSYKYLTN